MARPHSPRRPAPAAPVPHQSSAAAVEVAAIDEQALPRNSRTPAYPMVVGQEQPQAVPHSRPQHMDFNGADVTTMSTDMCEAAAPSLTKALSAEASTTASSVASCASNSCVRSADLDDALAWAGLSDAEIRQLAERTLGGQVAPVLLQQLSRQEIVILLTAHKKTSLPRNACASDSSTPRPCSTLPNGRLNLGHSAAVGGSRGSGGGAGGGNSVRSRCYDAKAGVPEPSVGRHLAERLGTARYAGVENGRARSSSPVRRNSLLDLGRDTTLSVPFALRPDFQRSRC